MKPELVRTVELQVDLKTGMDSFLRVINTLRKRGILVVTANFLGNSASFSVLAVDENRVRTNLNKLMDVQFV